MSSWDRHVAMGQRLVVEGVEAFLVEAGRGPPILLIHGWASSSFSWRRLLPLLERRYRAVAVDLPGFGLSRPLREGLRLGPVANHLSKLMRALGCERYAVIGHSMGGLFASYLAASDPGVVALALISPSIPLEEMGRPFYVRLGGNVVIGRVLSFFLVRRGFVRRALEGACHQRGVVDDEMVEGYFRSVQMSRETLLQGLRAREEFSEDVLRRVSVPSILIWGESDSWVPMSVGRAVAGMTGWRLEVIPGAGHLPQEEKPLEVFRVLEEFLGPLAL
jgi:pimeloyl-ACP methyl ester carboxylesterase